MKHHLSPEALSTAVTVPTNPQGPLRMTFTGFWHFVFFPSGLPPFQTVDTEVTVSWTLAKLDSSPPKCLWQPNQEHSRGLALDVSHSFI